VCCKLLGVYQPGPGEGGVGFIKYLYSFFVRSQYSYLGDSSVVLQCLSISTELKDGLIVVHVCRNNEMCI
jgi:hypothetical protein